MKKLNFNDYVGKFVTHFENRLNHCPSDYTQVNIIEMSLNDLRIDEYLKSGGFILFMLFPILLIFNPIGLYLTACLYFIWGMCFLLIVRIFHRFLPRLDYLYQIKRGIHEIVSLQRGNYQQLNPSQLKELLQPDNYSVMEKKYKLYCAQSVIKSEDKQKFEPRKMSNLLANYLISPEIIVIKTNDKLKNYPLCILYKIKEDNIKNYSNVLNIVNKIMVEGKKDLSLDNIYELNTYLKQVRHIYEDGLYKVDSILKKLS